MNSRVDAFITTLLGIERHERLKIALLGGTFFLVVGAYTLVKELKDSLFVHIVGKDYIPMAKILAMIALIPAILVFSRLVDLLRKHQLLNCYAVFYGIVGLIIAYFLAHPTIGLPNTDAHKGRIFGWFIYFFLEGYAPFVASVYWAFVNSITSPESAKNSYPILIAASKVGGILAAALPLVILRRNIHGVLYFSDAVNHQILLAAASLLLLFIPPLIYYLMKKVPSEQLHGYEATYQAEKKGLTGTKGEDMLTKLFSGLTLLIQYPYVLGIFGMIFFWEVVNTVFAYERLGVAKTIALNISDYTKFLFQGIIFMHLVGLIIVLVGTRPLINWLGERRSLMLVPIVTGILSCYYVFQRSPTAIIVTFVLLRAINYAFAQALRESLYIPTTKDMRFKSKSWIDAFGSKFAKSSGSVYNMIAQTVGPSFVGSANAAFFSVIIGSWVVTAYLLGRRFEKAVSRNEVIGLGNAHA